MLNRSVSNTALGGLIALIICLVGIVPVSAQTNVEYVEEIVVGFSIPKLIRQDIIVQYDGATVYLPLVEVFTLLELSIEADLENGSITGFIFSPDNRFNFDLTRSQARMDNRTYQLPSNLYFLSDNDLYLRVDQYRTIFGFNMTFDFSTLDVRMPLDEEFPSYQKMLREKARKRLRIEEMALRDVVELPRSRDRFRGGVADWVVATSPLGGAGHYFNLNLGGMVGGGDLSLSGTGNSMTGFQSDQIRYRWHYYLDDNKHISQIDLGDVAVGGILTRGLKGARISNEPQIQRRFFQTVGVSGHLGEGWEVELYLNNVLADFTVTDDAGEYNFMVDINYGSSRVMLKMYGPHGEIQTEERYYSVPQNLIPKGTIEYTVGAGSAAVQRETRRYLQANTRYGLFNNLSLGISGELPLESDKLEEPGVGVEMIVQPKSNLLITGGYAPNNQYRAMFSFSQPSVISINGSFTKFFPNPVRNPFGQQSRARLSFSSPLKIGGTRLGLRYFVARIKYPTFETIDMNYGFSTHLWRIHLNYMGNHKISKRSSGTEQATISKWFLSPRLVRWFSPQFRATYDHTVGAITKTGFHIAKRVFRTGQLALSYERDLESKTSSITATFNFFTNFADFATRLISHSGQSAVSQTQRGSVRFDQSARSFRFLRREGVGTGSAVIWPFLDHNYNGRRDPGEELLPELKANLRGSYGVRKGAGEVYYYDGLLPYDDYLVQIDKYSLDNPQLRPAHESYRVIINPNTVTGIAVPVVMAGEVSGVVERKIPGALVGIGGIKMIITNEATGQRAEVVSFNNGDYYYLGLVPGMYRISIDAELLARYGYQAEPTFRTFQMNTVAGGDIIEDINFVLAPKE